MNIDVSIKNDSIEIVTIDWLLKHQIKPDHYATCDVADLASRIFQKSDKRVIAFFLLEITDEISRNIRHSSISNDTTWRWFDDIFNQVKTYYKFQFLKNSLNRNDE